MVLRGTITPGAGFVTRIFGETDVDTIQFGDESGVWRSCSTCPATFLPREIDARLRGRATKTS